MHVDWQNLQRQVTAQFRLGADSVHGPFHWRCVERNGLWLAERTGACTTVVRLFALLHDSQREDDGFDIEHGPRAAAYLAQLQGSLFRLADHEYELLRLACEGHTNRDLSADPTIGTCWDADRLDLGRVGIAPSAKYMSTEWGRKAAEAGSISLLMG